MLLLLLCLLPAEGSSETSPGVLLKPTNQSCPEAGYFFERGNGSAPAQCYLCFCRGNGSAVCTLRPDTRCDERLYSHKKRNTSRVRRDREWTDFFRDATTKVLNTITPQQQQCKQNSSKSIGCPPADWCKGCTVCDCNANGIWDCHLMTFCDKKSKRPKKVPKSNKKNNSVKNESTLNNGNNANKTPTGKRKVKKILYNPTFIPKISVETKKTFVQNDQNEKSLVIKRYVSTIRPIKSPDLLKYKNNPSKLAQLLYRQYISNMSKAPNKLKKRMITDKHHGAKSANMKGILKNKRKQNKMKSQKPMNTNKNKHMNMEKVMKIKYKDDNKKQLNRTPAFKTQKYMASAYKTSKRAKRDVSVARDLPKNVTNIRGVEIANGTGYTHIYTFQNGSEVHFTTAKLKNYAYTVDNIVTTSMKNSQPNVSQYDTTEMQENANGNKTKDSITIEAMNTTTTQPTTSNGMKRKAATEKMPIEHTTNRGLKLNPVYSDILKNTQLMNDQNYEQNVKIEIVTKAFLNNQSEISNGVMKKKVSAQDIKKMTSAKKKFNLKKLVRTLHSHIRNTKISNFMNKSLIDNNSTRVKINGTLNDIQRLLDKMLHGATKNKKTNERLKTKSFAAIKYLKKLFSKLFSRSKNKTAVEKVAVYNSICETFGPCRISNKKMKLINLKVTELISETLKALNSIRIIKELLQLIHVHSDKRENATLKEPDFKIHVKQLNAILKEQYTPEINWTHTQVIQMNQIKSNTRVFIRSIGKFSTILNDIISIIKSENEKFNLKKNESIRNKRPNETDILSKMKRLLLKYDLIQNTFLHKIYAALTNVEERFKNRNEKELQYKYEPENNTNYKVTIEKYVDNINENLKKLKELAARMESRTRRKRDAKDDNAVDYLLTLMEYLLKRNNPIDTPPVNDGIDLIIEAIRRAPDIRPIQKQVLQYVPIKAASPAISAVSREDSDSKSKDNSKEDFKKSEDSADNDIEIIQFDDRKKNSKDNIASTTKRLGFVDLSAVITEIPSKVYMASFNPYENSEKTNNETASVIDLSAVITELPSKVYMASFNPNENAEKTDNDTASIIDTRINEETDALIGDDDNLKTIKKAEIDLELGITVRSTTVPIFKDPRLKMRHYTPITEKNSTTKEAKTKLDLINEAYEQEIKQQKEQTTVKPVVSRVKGETGKREQKVGSADISCVSKELVDQEKSPSPSQIETEKVFHRKQMDLLNLLDYGTDRSLMDDIDSRDSSPVDRLSNEAFQSY